MEDVGKHGQMKKDYRDGCEHASQLLVEGEIDPVRAKATKSEAYINGFIDTLRGIIESAEKEV